MITYTAAQNAVLNTKNYTVTWLFDVNPLPGLLDEDGEQILDELGNPILDEDDLSQYHWSFKSGTWDSTAYTARVIPESFSGITERASSACQGYVAPSDISFTVTNKGNVLDVDDFKSGGEWSQVVVKLLLNDVQFKVWTFRITDIADYNQRLHFTCEDYLQKVFEGTWPNSPAVSSLSEASAGDPDDNLCVPVPFGTAYVPIRSVYLSTDFFGLTSKRYYVLGPADGVTYSISEVQTPRNWSYSTWTSAVATFQQYTVPIDGVNYRVVQPLVAGGYNGIFFDGTNYLSPLVKFTRSDLATKTNPADIIEYLLRQWGVPSTKIDTGVGSTFASAATTYTGWGLTFEYGFYFPQEIEKLLADLLVACDSTLRMTDKIELHPHNRASQKTLTDADILRFGRTGTTTFQAGTVKRSTKNDAATTSFCESGEPQDYLFKIICTADGTDTYSNLSSDNFQNPYVHDDQNAKRIGELWAQQKFWPDRTYSFGTSRDHLNLQPDDVITLNDTKYGGSFKVAIDEVKFDRMGRPSFQVYSTTSDLEDFDDSTPGAVTAQTDSTTATYTQVFSGTSTTVSSGTTPNALTGAIEIVTNGEIKTNIDPATNGGLIIDNTEIKGYNSGGTLLLNLIYNGTNEGDAYIGDYDSRNPGLKYDHSAATLSMIANLELLKGMDITMRSISGATEADRSIIKLPVSGSEEFRIYADYDNYYFCIAPDSDYTTNQTQFLVGYDWLLGYKRFYNISFIAYCSTVFTAQNGSDISYVEVSSEDVFGETTVDLYSKHNTGAVAQCFLSSDANCGGAGIDSFALIKAEALQLTMCVANTNTPSGATAYALPIYNDSGTLLGYAPIYGAAW